MVVDVNVKLSGLFTSGNTLEGTPKGSMRSCNHIVINEDHLVESRKGLHKLPSPFTVSSHRALSLHSFDGFLHAVTTNKDYLFWNGSSWVNNGILDVSSRHVPVASMNSNLYILTDAGLVKHQQFNTQPEPAGLPKATNTTVELIDSVGFLPDASQVSYRLVWFLRDSNNNLVFGGVSERTTATNTSGGSRNVRLRANIPIGITEGMGYQFYRSETTASDIPSSDNLQLVFENSVTGDNINDGFVEVDDLTPAELRGAFIYTAGTQEGLVNNNDTIPLAKTMAVFNNILFLGNVSYQHRAFLDLLGVGSPNGVQIGDTLTIAGVTYTAASNQNVSSKQFKVFSLGTPSQNIQETMQDLIHVVNSGSDDMYGFYISSLDDISGKSFFERRTVQGSSFSITVSRSSAWNIKNETSTNDARANKLAFSKLDQPEHFSLVNTLLVGGSVIYKIVALRESLIIATDTGFHRLSGFAGNFSVELLDSSAILLNPDTCHVLNNELFALTTQGVTIINSQGVKIISRDIEENILIGIKENLAQIQAHGFAISNETERRYYLFLPKQNDYCEEVYIYNSFTQDWVFWTIDTVCATTHNQQLYLGYATGPLVLELQKGTSHPSYADYYNDVTAVEIYEYSIVIVEIPSQLVSKNDVLLQGNTWFRIESFDDTSKQIFFKTPHTFNAGSLKVHQSIPLSVEFNPIYGGNPSITKQWIRGHLYYKAGLEGPVDLEFTTDTVKVAYKYSFEGEKRVGWGELPWGSFSWGGEAAQEEYFSFRGLRGGQIFVRYKQKFAYTATQFQGMAFQLRKVNSLRFRRPK